MRWYSEDHSEGYKWRFAFLPFRLKNGPRVVWVWWEWYQVFYDGVCCNIRLSPRDDDLSGPHTQEDGNG